MVKALCLGFCPACAFAVAEAVAGFGDEAPVGGLQSAVAGVVEAIGAGGEAGGLAGMVLGQAQAGHVVPEDGVARFDAQGALEVGFDHHGVASVDGGAGLFEQGDHGAAGAGRQRNRSGDVGWAGAEALSARRREGAGGDEK